MESWTYGLYITADLLLVSRTRIIEVDSGEFAQTPILGASAVGQFGVLSSRYSLCYGTARSGVWDNRMCGMFGSPFGGLPDAQCAYFDMTV